MGDTKIDALREFIADTEWPDYKYQMGQVFRCGDFAFVTDSHCLLAFRSDAEADAVFPLKIDGADKLINASLADGYYDLAHLKAFCDRPATECELCHGTKIIPCDKGPCDECDYEGSVECICPVFICEEVFGKPVNILLLKKCLKNLSGHFQIGADHERLTALVLAGEGWRVAVMPMKRETTEKYEPVTVEVARK